MNKILLGFNVILGAAVVYLFFKKPTETEKKNGNKTTQELPFSGEKSKGDLRIAFLTVDSLNENYQLFKDELKKMESVVQQLNQEVMDEERKAMMKAQALQKDFQYKPQSEQQRVGMLLQKMEQDFMMFKAKRERHIDSLQSAVTQRGEKALKKFLKTYCKENKIDFVLRDGIASSIMFGDTIFDITKLVTKALNDEYQKSK